MSAAADTTVSVTKFAGGIGVLEAAMDTIKGFIKGFAREESGNPRIKEAAVSSLVHILCMTINLHRTRLN